jgi:hypothetical protein
MALMNMKDGRDIVHIGRLLVIPFLARTVTHIEHKKTYILPQRAAPASLPATLPHVEPPSEPSRPSVSAVARYPQEIVSAIS